LVKTNTDEKNLDEEILKLKDKLASKNRPATANRNSLDDPMPSLFNSVNNTYGDFDDMHMDIVEQLIDPAKATNIKVEAPFVYVGLDRPLDKPIPSTVGGHILITSHEPMPNHLLGKVGKGDDIGPISGLKPYSIPSDDQLDAILDYFSEYNPQAVMVLGPLCTISFPKRHKNEFAALLQELPSHIGLLVASYLNGFLDVIPSATNPRQTPAIHGPGNDKSNHSRPLSPGICVSSRNEDGDVYYTTSGVVVTKQGRKRLTAAAHGLKGSTGVLYHGDTPIADLDMIIPNTNIALMTLRDGINYTNESSIDGTISKLVPIHRLPVRPIAKCYSDTSISGRQDGIFVGKCRWSKYPETELGSTRFTQNILVTTNMAELDNGGVCGAPIITELPHNGGRGVLGFHHYSQVLDPMNGNSRTQFSFAQPVEPLVEHGWSLISSSNDAVSGITSRLSNHISNDDMDIHSRRAKRTVSSDDSPLPAAKKQRTIPPKTTKTTKTKATTSTRKTPARNAPQSTKVSSLK
jgi:hypothetical protein